MVKTLRVFLSLLLALSMLGGGLTALAEEAAGTDTPLVVTYDQFSQKFSPFFGDSQMDVDATDMTQLYILTYDRLGAVVENAIEGETRKYEGMDYTYTGAADVSVNYDEAADKTVYTIKLRDDIVFSDGVPLTADDVIFTYYVYCDPSYVGSITVNSYSIVGLQNYRTQTSENVYAKYQAVVAAISAAGPDHVWAEGDGFTKEQQEGYWTALKANWVGVVQSIVDYCMANYTDYIQDTVGYSPDEVKADEGLQVAFGMALWGFGEVADGVLTSKSGKTWTLAESKPTIEDYYENLRVL
jgi:peptide/nickel transport system substrate-binding protein